MTTLQDIPVHHVDEIDDSDPEAPAFDTINQAMVRAMQESFARSGCLVKCEGKAYRPFCIRRTRVGWWRIEMRQVNVPLSTPEA